MCQPENFLVMGRHEHQPFSPYINSLFSDRVPHCQLNHSKKLIYASVYQTFKQSYLRLKGLCSRFMGFFLMGRVQFMLCAMDTAGAVFVNVVYLTLTLRHLCEQHLSPRQIPPHDILFYSPIKYILWYRNVS